MSDIKTAAMIILSISLLHGFVVTLNCSSPTPKSLYGELEKELSTRKLYRPVNKFSDPLNISVDITVVGILGVNEKQQSLTTYIWQVLHWNIEGLSWDEKECGTARVSVSRETLWIPDIHITEFMEHDQSPHTPYVYLHNTGHVFDDKPIKVVSSCKLVIYTFPFDVQNCSLTFGSYMHYAEDIRMSSWSTAEQILEESLRVAQTKGEWELVNVQLAPTVLEISEGSYSDISIYIILRRRPILYVVNLILPSCFLVTVDLFSFLLPPQSVDRSSFKMTLILGYTVFLLLINDLLPVTGNEASLLNVFFSLSFALMVASLLETIFITNIQFSSNHYHAVPHWLNVLVLRYLAVIVCLPPIKKSNRITVSLPGQAKVVPSSIIPSRAPQNFSDNSPPFKTPLDPTVEELKKLSRDLMAIRLQIDNYFQGGKNSGDWKMIGAVFDRLLSGLYFVFICVSFTTIGVLWNFSDSSHVK